MDEKQLQAQLDALKTELEKAVSEKAKKDLEAQIKALEAKIPDTKGLSDDVTILKEWTVKKDEADKKNQEALDTLIADRKNIKNTTKTRSFGDAFSSSIEENYDQIKSIEKKKGTVILDIKDFNVKTVGDMALSSNLSGDQVATYVGQGVIPADLINFRDLIPTRQTATGLAVTYRESAGEGAVARQTEGSAKAQVDSDFTEVKVVQRYISAYQRASKQILQDLPFLQTTLPRILMRKYMQKENTLLYADMSSSTYSTANSPSGGNTVEKILNMIKTQRASNFSASFVLITWDDWYNILIGTRPSTGVDYSTPGGVVVTPTGDIMVAGVKVIPASWVTTSDIQVIDTAYVERVEVDGLRVELSTEDANNFTENKVTMRVECRTDLNVLLKAAHLNYGTAS
jgi:hypothetical protein